MERKDKQSFSNDSPTASEFIKRFGIRSLKDLAEKEGVSPSTIHRWFANDKKRNLFLIPAIDRYLAEKPAKGGKNEKA